MDTWTQLMRGFSIALQPIYLLYCLAGGCLGVIVGALPGLGSVAGTAMLLPIVYTLDPTAAIILLAALYYGNMFGGAISSILINIPGDAPAVMAAIDGFKMTQNGRSGQALFTMFISSAIGGMIGCILLTALGSTLASIGLSFGPAEMTMLILVAMTSIGWILGDNPVKGLVATGFGLILACIGLDIQQGGARLTFGIFYLMAGIPFIPAIIGMFGFSQVIITMVEGIEKKQEVRVQRITYRNSWPTKTEWKGIIPTATRTSILGFIVGMLPGSGATTAAFLAYITEKRINRKRAEFGTGIAEGVAAAEAADNAASIGAFGPMLSLGIPGSGTTAVLLGALLMLGLQPGPLFMTQNPEFTWALIASMFVGDIIVLALCVATIPILVYLLKVPKTILVPIILCVSMIGAYCVNNSMTDIYIMIIFGIIGYFFLRFEISLVPIVLSLVLGPTLEMSMRQAFTISNGSTSIFFNRPISLGLFIVGLVFILMPLVLKIFKKKVIK